jgi:hypothetical protein
MADEKSNADLDLHEVSRDSANSTFAQSGDQKKGEPVTVIETLGTPTPAKASDDKSTAKRSS